MTRRTDSASRLIDAEPAAAYRALLDPVALMAWLPPRTMTGRLLEFDPRPGGRYRIELRYSTEEGHPAEGMGKTTAGTDISGGRFLELVPDRTIVQSVEFESDDPAFAGEMIMTWSFRPAPAGATEVSVTAENVPPGISQVDHDAGLASSLDNLARYLTGDRSRS